MKLAVALLDIMAISGQSDLQQVLAAIQSADTHECEIRHHLGESRRYGRESGHDRHDPDGQFVAHQVIGASLCGRWRSFERRWEQR